MKILCKPNEVMACYYNFVKNTNVNMVMAENEGMQVSMFDEDGFPKLIVSYEDKILDAMTLDDPLEAPVITEEFYKQYIYEDEDMDDPVVQDSVIKEREQELEDAAIDFLSVVLEKNISETEKECKGMVAEFIDHVMEYLFTEHSIDPYRPMVLVDDEENEYFEEYPYSVMEIA